MFQKKMSTDDLMKQLNQSCDIRKYIENEEVSLQTLCISDYLNLIIEQQNISRARIIEKAGIDRVYGYEILRGKKIPGRDTLLRFLISLKIEINDIQYILKNTEYPILYPKNMRDAIIIYGIQKSFDLDRLNAMLYDLGQKTI
jgi:hypothetical protein